MNEKHGVSGNPLYKVWLQIKGRCLDQSHPRYKDWGARGVSVFNEWIEDPRPFIAYVNENLGEKPSASHSIDRICNESGYVPGNLRWATPTEQNRNQKSNRVLSFNGETMLMEDWAARLGVTPSTLHYRLSKWSVEDALSRTKRKQNRNRNLNQL